MVKTIERCFYQIFKTQTDCKGNCYTCKTDELNKECERYVPIKISTYEIQNSYT